ncbi:MAG: InlB B-repeat-containing protein, partial [Caldilineaceae bacterium]|nr:InlB B-repeat-containing protein [Caldilineaceae bacterium]
GGAFRFTHTLNASEIGFFAGNVGDVSVNGAAPAFTAIFDYFFNDAARISPEDSTALYLHSLATQPTSGGIANSVPVSPTVGSPANCGSPIQLTATAQPGWSFDRWISTKGSVSGIANPLVTDFDFDEDVTAVFKQDAYTLDRSVIGSGAITVAPLADTYTYSDVVQLTAVPAPGWSFAGWSGAATGNNLTTSFRITGNAAVTATFTQDEYTLTVHTVGDATGTVTVTPPQQTYHYSDVVTLQANPAPGAIFAGWSGALTGDQLAKSLTITGNADVTATFVKDLFALNVSIVSEHADDEAGDGGTVTATPDKTNYVFNETVNLVAEAKPGWSFSGWSGDAIGATPAIAVIMTDNKAVTATFTQEQYTVTRTTSGTGQGTIVVSPTQTAYLYGDVVTVEAVPADGSIFTGWSGAVSGSAPAQTLTITADSAIEAAFALREYHINATVVGGQDGEVPGTVTIAPAAPYHFG